MKKVYCEDCKYFNKIEFFGFPYCDKPYLTYRDWRHEYKLQVKPWEKNDKNDCKDFVRK